MFDEMIVEGLIAKGYTREPNANLVVGTVAAVLAGERKAPDSQGDGIFRLDDFDRGRHAARELFGCIAVDLDMDDGELPDTIDARTLDDAGWKMLVAAIAAETFEGSTLGELRELGMIEDDVVPVHFDDAQLDRLRDSLRAEGWRVAVGTRRGFEKWTPTGDNPLGGEGVIIREGGAAWWVEQDDRVYVEPCNGSAGPEDIRFAGSPTFTKSFKLRG